MRQSVARISEELGIHVVTLYNWRKVWRLQGVRAGIRERP
jgi:transposase-like protein